MRTRAQGMRSRGSHAVPEPEGEPTRRPDGATLREEFVAEQHDVRRRDREDRPAQWLEAPKVQNIKPRPVQDESWPPSGTGRVRTWIASW
jgi:hypothetical protein